jgi:hypothetical protein
VITIFSSGLEISCLVSYVVSCIVVFGVVVFGFSSVTYFLVGFIASSVLFKKYLALSHFPGICPCSYTGLVSVFTVLVLSLRLGVLYQCSLFFQSKSPFVVFILAASTLSNPSKFSLIYLLNSSGLSFKASSSSLSFPEN